MPEAVTTLKSKIYTNPTRRIFGEGSFAELPSVLESFTPKTILLVLGEISFRMSSYYPRLEQMLSFYNGVESSPVGQNPTADFIEEEVRRLKTISYDLVLAIGGGSVLDVSKILAVLPKQPVLSLEQCMNSSFILEVAPVPLVALPTTSGTGSEVTPYVSLETNDKKKITIQHPNFYPAVALIDPERTYSMSSYRTAATGFDALSQAIESFWSIHATPFSQTHALRAIDLILPSLEKAFEEQNNAPARAAMSLASCEAGLAIAQTKTTAVHSVSYPITTHFKIAHGHACALTLAPFVRFNAPAIKSENLLAVFKAANYDQMAKKIESLMDKTGLERSLAQLGIDAQGRETIVRDGFRPDRMLNNPRPVTAEDLRHILEAIQ